MQYSAVEMIGKLVSFDTVSHKSNLELIGFVEDYLASHGVASKRVLSPEGDKANLYATIGPQVEGGIILSGHTDVVPVEGQPWTTDPFQMVEKDGRLYGRGTADMKAFSAIGLSLVPEMLKADLKRPIHFALSYDEEVGCTGVGSMVEEMIETLPKPEAVIVGEPSLMKIVNAHKSIFARKTIVTGRAAHSSLTDRGVSAVMMAAQLVALLDDMAEECRRNAGPDCPFDPPYTTIHVGQINGGTALNIISERCEFVWDVRNVPEDDPDDFVRRFEARADELRARMKAVDPDCDIVTTVLSDAPALAPEDKGAAEVLCAQITGLNATDVVSYATEAGHFQRVGYSTVVCGPGSIDQAHQADEFIALDQVKAGEEFLRKIVRYLS